MSRADEPQVEAVHEHLLRTGALAEVRLGGVDERRWLDCDLASLAENRLGDRTDPRDLDEARRADWLARATEEPPWSLGDRARFERCYWLREGNDRVGTIALATSLVGSRSVRLSSFYVLPSHRNRGTGRRALARVQDGLAQHRLGLRLETSWCWQRAVRFYFAAGLWVYMWKRELSFCWSPGTPPPRIEVGPSEATLSLQPGADSVLLARARRRDDALELDDCDKALADDTRLGEAYWHAQSTLAVALALRGWPLIRSREEWDSSYYADAGAPESLAYKITIWEAMAGRRGWPINTPRIPGLGYPTWEELEARWEAESKELEASLGATKE